MMTKQELYEQWRSMVISEFKAKVLELTKDINGTWNVSVYLEYLDVYAYANDADLYQQVYDLLNALDFVEKYTLVSLGDIVMTSEGKNEA